MAAIINSDTIFSTEIDSIIDEYVFELKSIILDQQINSLLVDKVAQKENLSKDDYLKQRGFKKDDGLENEKILVFLDSLKEDAAIKILIRPNYFKEITAENLIKSTIQEGKGINNVYFVSDYNCPHCQTIQKQFNEIVKNYPDINFHFVYHSDYVDEKSLFAYACGLQGHFTESYNWLFSDNYYIYDKNLFLGFAFDLGIDIAELEMQMNCDQLLKEFVANRNYLIDNGVNKVPCFIVNNKLLISGNPIMYLQNVIDHEFDN